MTATLRSVPPSPPEEVERLLRANARARTIDAIGTIKPRDNVKHYPGGHEWVRYPHEAVVLRAKEALER